MTFDKSAGNSPAFLAKTFCNAICRKKLNSYQPFVLLNRSFPLLHPSVYLCCYSLHSLCLSFHLTESVDLSQQVRSPSSESMVMTITKTPLCTNRALLKPLNYSRSSKKKLEKNAPVCIPRINMNIYIHIQQKILLFCGRTAQLSRTELSAEPDCPLLHILQHGQPGYAAVLSAEGRVYGSPELWRYGGIYTADTEREKERQ